MTSSGSFVHPVTRRLQRPEAGRVGTSRPPLRRGLIPPSAVVTAPSIQPISSQSAANQQPPPASISSYLVPQPHILAPWSPHPAQSSSPSSLPFFSFPLTLAPPPWCPVINESFHTPGLAPAPAPGGWHGRIHLMSVA